MRLAERKPYPVELRVSCRRVKLKLHGYKVTSDAGLLFILELDAPFGFGEMDRLTLTATKISKNNRRPLRPHSMN